MLCCTPLMSRMWTPSNFCSRLTSSSPARKTSRSVTSLGSVTPGAATEGVTPLFFPEKPGVLFFAHRCHYHYRFLLLSLGYVTPSRVSLHNFFTCTTSFFHYSLYICTQIFFSFGCHPLEGVTRGGPPPSRPLVTPLLQVSDVNGYHQGAHCWSERPADDFEVFTVVAT